MSTLLFTRHVITALYFDYADAPKILLRCYALPMMAAERHYAARYAALTLGIPKERREEFYVAHACRTGHASSPNAHALYSSHALTSRTFDYVFTPAAPAMRSICSGITSERDARA